MARRAVADRRKQVTDALGRMMRDYLMVHVFKGMSEDDAAKRMGVGAHIFKVPWWQDVPQIAESAGLDLGIALRDRKGNEVTLFPEENLGTPVREPKVAAKDYAISAAAIGFRHSKR